MMWAVPDVSWALGVLWWVMLGASAVNDIRTRRFTCAQGAAISLVSSLRVLEIEGTGRLMKNALMALAASTLLVCAECIWRRMRHEVGMGMGDIRFLFAIMLNMPCLGMRAFLVGLVSLAAAGVLSRRRVLPLIPFVVAGLAILPHAP